MVWLTELIQAIETCQPVLNKSELQDSQKQVTHVAQLTDADSDAVAFVSSHKYIADLEHSTAGVILVSHKLLGQIKSPAGVLVVVADAYLAHASISTLFAYQALGGIHESAIIAASASIGQGACIGAGSIIGERVVIGDHAHIGAYAVLEDDVTIGDHVFLGNHVSIAHGCVLGDNVRIHSQASIGSEGFGFAPNPSATGMQWQRIAQLGRVIIGNNVRIGAQTCVDRGAVGDTLIGDHVIIDNLVQIAHNVRIGSGTAIAANTGIAGSTTIGKNCIIAGATAINGHIDIADGVTLTGMSMVISSIKEAGSYSSGTPAMPSMNWRRAASKFRHSGDK